MTPEQHLAAWQELHGVEPSTVVRWWLRLVLLVARPLAFLRVSASALTGLGLLVTVAALVSPAPWALVLLAGLIDGLDGAVAVLRGTASARGADLDRWADRLGELVFAALVVQAGAPLALGIVSALLVLALEILRRRAGRVGTITVAERPVRVLFTAAALLVHPTACLAVLVALTGVALVQLGAVLRRERIVAGP